MNWLTNYVRPKLQGLVGAKEIPDNLWEKCPNCGAMIYHRELEQNSFICNQCNHHMRINPKQRLEMYRPSSNSISKRSSDVPIKAFGFPESSAATVRCSAFSIACGTYFLMLFISAFERKICVALTECFQISKRSVSSSGFLSCISHIFISESYPCKFRFGDV